MGGINLKATEHFEAVARLGGVTKAAAELDVSPSAVSQQIRALEKQFGVTLFRREKRRLVLTLEGDRLFQTTTKALTAIRNAHGAIARAGRHRDLAIRVSPGFGVRWLGPRIAAFAEENVEWNIRIDASPEFSAFDTEVVDADLRYGLGGWSGLSVNCILHDLVMPMGSPAYLEMLRERADTLTGRLRAARLIDSVKTIYRWDLWLAANEIELDDLTYPLRFDRSSMAIEMARQGGGLVLDSVTLCLPEIERGELAPLCPEIPVIDFPAYWFVCPPRHLNRRIVRRFADWLDASCAEHDARARAVLRDLGCVFRSETSPELFNVQHGGL